MQRLEPRVSALAGGLEVRRVLPQLARRSVGPFVFFDHFGPVELAADVDSDVGPHPHIGLATVTYLFEGRMLHADSLGVRQEIAPGAVNWMSAGGGIVHSERTVEAERGRARRLHGLQLWAALPEALEQSSPSFQHVPAAELAPFEVGGARVRVLVGEAFGARSPVRVASPTLYLDVELPAGAHWPLPALAEELALYAVDAPLELSGQPLEAQRMAVLDGAVRVRAFAPSRFVVIGGAPLGPRHMWWNFVASDRARIERAAQRWEADAFPAIAGERDRIAMPRYDPRRSS